MGLMIEFSSPPTRTATSAVTSKDYRLHEQFCFWVLMGWLKQVCHLDALDVGPISIRPHGWPIQPGTTGRS